METCIVSHVYKQPYPAKNMVTQELKHHLVSKVSLRGLKKIQESVVDIIN